MNAKDKNFHQDEAASHVALAKHFSICRTVTTQPPTVWTNQIQPAQPPCVNVRDVLRHFQRTRQQRTTPCKRLRKSRAG